MKSRIALILPPRTGSGKRDVGALMMSPHIGVAYIASSLLERGADVKIIDAVAEGLSLEDVCRAVEEYKPDAAALTAMTDRINDAADTAGAIKRRLPGVKTIVGGSHPSAMPRETLEEFEEFDAAAFGEGEETALEFVAAIETGEYSKVAGLAFRSGGQTIVNMPRARISNLDALPFPAFELFDMDRYLAFYTRSREIIELPVSSARGCPFKCAFCSKVMGENLVYRSVENVINELRHNVERFRASQFVMTDESFTFSHKRTMEFCDRYIECGLHRKANFIVHSRVDVTKELLEKMRAANCRHITFGLESGNQEVLDKNVKKITLQKSIDAVRMAREAGMVTDGNFILGLPYETRKTIRDTISFAIRCNPDYASFFLFVPYPGSAAWDMANRGEGNLRLLSRNWRDYGKQVGGAAELEGVSRKSLEMAQFAGYLRFYLRPSRLKIVFKKIDLKTAIKYALSIFRTSAGK